MKRMFSCVILVLLLLTSILALAFNVQLSESEWTGTVYIRADGSIDPPTAPIITYDYVTYTLVDNITSSGDGIVVERDNIKFDGNGFTLQGSDVEGSVGIDLTGLNNVTIKRINITDFYHGILLDYSSYCTIEENSIYSNWDGIAGYSEKNTLIRNNTIRRCQWGIWGSIINNCMIAMNTIIDNGYGIQIGGEDVTIVTNEVKQNAFGLFLMGLENSLIKNNSVTRNYYVGLHMYDTYEFPCRDNLIYHNNFAFNGLEGQSQVSLKTAYINVWDDGYPSGGNYWSDYAGVDEKSGPNQDQPGSDGIGDTPYVIDENNQDRYPLMYPYGPGEQPCQDLIVEWDRTYGTVNDDFATSLICTSDGGFAMVGLWNATSLYVHSIGLVKTDSAGRMQWNKSYSIGHINRRIVNPLLCSLVETNDGGFAVATTANCSGDLNFMLIKTNSFGEIIWSHTYGGPDLELCLSAIQTKPDNGFLLVGWSNQSSGMIFLVKTDENGNIQWEKKPGLGVASDVVQTSDGGYVLACRSMLLKVNSTGDWEWNQNYDLVMLSWSLIQTNDGGFAIAGLYFPHDKDDAIVIKTDGLGNMEWNKTYDNDQADDVAISIVQVDDGGYAIIGGTKKQLLYDAWLLITDARGNLNQSYTFGTNESNDAGLSIVRTEDKGFAFAGGTNSSGNNLDFWLVKLTSKTPDVEPPVIKNVRHDPLYPMENDIIYFYADVTDNVAVAGVQLNYTLDRATWLLKDMILMEGNTYSTHLGPFNQFQIVGFYVIAYDTSGNKACGSEIVPPIPGPPKVAPIVVSSEPPNPLPDGKDVGYNVTDKGVQVFANVSELGLYGPGLLYTISYSLDGGLTWIQAGMTYIGGYIWRYVIPALTNILFKIIASDGRSSMVYWIIVGPWKYPIYLYFSVNEKYYPVQGLDFDYSHTGNYDITNNKWSYDTYFSNYRPKDLDGDGTPDVPAYAYMNPKTLDDGCLVIEYWIYYAFNDYMVIDKHEHDFESIFIWVDVATGNIKKIALSQHTWVNHYLLNVPPTRRINVAVELGGHGMQLLADLNEDGLPDEDPSGNYLLAMPLEPAVLLPPLGYPGLPPFWGRICSDSVVARIYPWTIYDTRKPRNELHLFGDSDILTAGLPTFFLFPHLIQDPATGNIDQSATENLYNYVISLIGNKTLLKTSYALKIPISKDFDLNLAFMVMAPWYRKEFTDPGLEWLKLSYGLWIAKKGIEFAVYIKTGGLIGAIKTAVVRGILTPLALQVVTKIISWLVDPVSCSIIDQSGNVLGYRDHNIITEITGSYVFITRNMTCNLYDIFIILTNQTEGLIYEVVGTEPLSTYNFTLTCTYDSGFALNFKVMDIPIHQGEMHRYVINWTMLEHMEQGVEVLVDKNGDGVFEQKFNSDSTLTPDEFEAATTDNTPPEISDPVQNPLENIKPFQNVTIKVDITDYGTGIYNVTLWYSKDNGTTWNTINMMKITAGTYQATIPGYKNCTWVTYKIIAYDNAGNRATKDNNGDNYRYHVIPEFSPTLTLVIFTLTTLIATIILRAKRKQQFT